MNSIRQYLVKIVAVVLCVVMMIPININAAQPETVQPLANAYIEEYSGSITRFGGGKIEIEFSVVCSRTMTNIGVSGITLYESSDNYDWFPVKTYYSSNIPSMMGSNRSTYSSHVSYNGTAGYYYQAHITFYASNSSGSGTSLYWTAVVKAT